MDYRGGVEKEWEEEEIVTMTCDNGGFWPLASGFWQLIEKLMSLILLSSFQ